MRPSSSGGIPALVFAIGELKMFQCHRNYNYKKPNQQNINLTLVSAVTALLRVLQAISER